MTVETKKKPPEFTEQQKRRGFFNWQFDAVKHLWPHPALARWQKETPGEFRLISQLCYRAEEEVLHLAVKVLKNPKLAIAALRGSRGNLGQLHDDLIAIRDGLKEIHEVTNPELGKSGGSLADKLDREAMNVVNKVESRFDALE